MDQFWDKRDPVLSPCIQRLLTDYSHISPERLIEHVKEIRSRAWRIRPYPCLGSYMFLDLSMSQHPAYGQVLESLLSDETDTTLLDLGCCLGQDLRKLAHDGVSGNRLAGYDIEHGFFAVGYEAFCDESHFQAKFLSGDFLGESGSDRSSEDLISSKRYDFIHAADFFHLWSWEKQMQAYTKAVLMLEDRPGCLLFGRNSGVEKARQLDQGPFASPNGDHTWLHDAESMRRMLELVRKQTGRQLEIVVDESPVVDEHILKAKAVVELGWTKRLKFTIRVS